MPHDIRWTLPRRSVGGTPEVDQHRNPLCSRSLRRLGAKVSKSRCWRLTGLGPLTAEPSANRESPTFDSTICGKRRSRTHRGEGPRRIGARPVGPIPIRGGLPWNRRENPGGDCRHNQRRRQPGSSHWRELFSSETRSTPPKERGLLLVAAETNSNVPNAPALGAPSVCVKVAAPFLSSFNTFFTCLP